MITITQGPQTARQRAHRQGVSIYQAWVAEEAATVYERLRKRAQRKRYQIRHRVEADVDLYHQGTRYWDGYQVGVKDALQGLVDTL